MRYEPNVDTYRKFHFLVFVRLSVCPVSRPWFKMQPLKQRSPSSRFAFQAPVPSNHLHEFLPFSKLDFRNIIQNPVDNQGGNDGRTRLVRFSVGPGRLGKRSTIFLCNSFSFKGNFTRILLLFLPRRTMSMFSNTRRTTYRKMFFAVTGQSNRF